MDAQDKRRGWTNGPPMFCAIPAVGSGEGITGVPIASGPVSGVLLSVVLAVLVLATWWLMRRWSTGGPGPAAPAPAAASGPVDDATAGATPVATDVRAEERELARR